MTACKILIIHPTLWSHYRAKVFSEFYEICQKESIELKILQVAINREGRKLGSVDVETHRYPYKLLFKKNTEQINMPEKILSQLREVYAYKPDVLTLPGYSDLSSWFVLVFAKIIMKTKVIVVSDSTASDRPRTFLKETIKRAFIWMCDGAFCCGTAAAKYVQSLGMSKDAVFIQYLATDNKVIQTVFEAAKKDRETLKIQYGVNSKNFVYVGRLSAEKNLFGLLKAFKSVKETVPQSKDWGLIIVGDGAQRRELEQFVELKGMPHVVFTGGESWREVSVFYALAEVGILPSFSETWGLVVNEAMVCGFPVIVSNRAGAAFDLVREGENGFKFDPESPDELAGIMKKFFAGEVDAAEMGKRSQEIIKDYTPEAAALQMLHGIKSVLGMRQK